MAKLPHSSCMHQDAGTGGARRLTNPVDFRKPSGPTLTSNYRTSRDRARDNGNEMQHKPAHQRRAEPTIPHKRRRKKLIAADCSALCAGPPRLHFAVDDTLSCFFFQLWGSFSFPSLPCLRAPETGSCQMPFPVFFSRLWFACSRTKKKMRKTLMKPDENHKRLIHHVVRVQRTRNNIERSP